MIRSVSPLRAVLAAALSLYLAACSGGSGDGSGVEPGPNRSPVATADTRVLPLAMAVSIDPLTNDTDPDGDPLSLTAITAPDAGTADVFGNTILYTPGPDFTGSDDFTYTISDGRDGVATASIVIELSASSGNTAPIAGPDNVEVGMNDSVYVAVLDNDSDPDGDPIAITSMQQPPHGTATLDDGGTPADPTDDRLLYVPDPGYTGPDSFTYRISDGVAEAVAAVNVVVGGVSGEVVSGIVSKGPVADALVELHAANAAGNPTGPVLASTVTNSAGHWSTSVTGRSGSLIVTVTGGRYFDEVTAASGNLNAALVEVESPDALSAALPLAENFVAITPFSHAVLLRARLLAGGDFETALADARAIIGTALGFDPLGVTPGNPLLQQTGADEPSAYALTLGGLANSLGTLSSATGVAVPVEKLLRAVAEDLTDCVLDGASVAGPVSAELSGVTLALPDAADLNADILRFRNNNFANFAMTPTVSVDASDCTQAASLPPVFDILPMALTVDAASAAGTPATAPQIAAFLAAALALDADGNPLAVSNDAPAVFVVGTTPVTFTATDDTGNSTSTAVAVTVADLSAPVIVTPDPVNATQTGALTAIALATPVVTDNVSAPANIALTNDAPAAGFPLGTTTVTWTAQDEAGLTATATQTVSIVAAGGPAVVAPLPDTSVAQGGPLVIATASAFDPGPHSYSIVGLPPGTGLSIDPVTGVLSGTPTNADALASPMSLSVVATNAFGAVAVPLNLSIPNINDAPVVTTPPAPVAASQGDSFAMDLNDVFSDPDLDSLVFSATGLPPGLALAVDGTITGMFGEADVSGSPYSVLLGASDGALNATTTLSISVANVNDAPVVVSPPTNRNLTEDVFTSFDIAASFSDPESDALSFLFAGLPPSLTGSATGTISGAPTNDDVAGSPFGVTVTATDTGGASVSASFLLTVQNVNDAPQLLASIGDQAAVQDLPFLLDAGARFDDPDGDALTFTVTGLPTSLSIDAAGVISGTPADADTGGSPYTVIVTATDDSGASVSDTFELTVVDTNDAPQVSPIADAAPVAEDSATLSIPFTISDAETAAASLSVTVTASNPVLLPAPSLVVNGTEEMRTLELTPAADRSGSSLVTVSVSDGTVSTDTTFLFTVQAVNDAPAFTLSGDVSDDEDFAGALAVTVTPDPVPIDETGQAVVYSLSPASVGFANVSIDPADGSVSVSAVADATGTRVFTVTADDGQGANNLATATFTLTINAINDVPAITAQTGPLSTSEETGIAITLADLVVSDPDNSYPADFTLAVQAGANYTVTGNTVTPVSNFTGTLNVPATVSDGTDTSASFVINVDVTNVNDVPVITAQAGPLSTPEETGLVLGLGDLVVTDPDNSYPAGFTLVAQPGPNYTAAGATVTPGIDFTGTLNVPVVVNDGTDDSAPFVLTVNVTAVNDVPAITAQTGPLSTPEETDLVLSLADLAVTDPDNGYPADFTLAVQAGADYTFAGTTVTPDTDFTGTLNVSVTVNDGTDNSAPFVVNVDVTNVNDVPVITAQSGPLSTPEETDLVLGLGDLVVTDPDNSYPADFTLAVQAGANYTFAGTTVTPATDFTGTLNVPVTVNDGTDDSAPFVVNVDVTNVNDAPVITAQSGPLSTPEETGLELTLASLVVTDPDNSYPADFTLAVQAGANYTAAGATITPATDFTGTLNVSVTVNDGTNDSAPFVLTVNVTAVNDVPAITAQTGPLSTPEETGIVLALADLAVTDPDNSYPADFTLAVQAGANYTFAGTTVTPNLDFFGTLSVPVTVNDGAADSAPFVVNVDVTAVNDVPVITAQTGPLSTPEEIDLVLGLADLAVTDPDNSYPADFTLAVQAGANYTFAGTTVTPDTDFTGTLNVSVTVNDGTDGSAPFVVNVDVTAVNDVPVITAQTGPLSTPEETGIALTFASLAVSDPDNSYPTGFTLAVQAGANYTFAGTTVTPDTDFTGTLNVPVTVNDGTDDSAPFVVNVDVTNVNDAPVITAQSGPLSTPEETDIVLALADLVVTDPDNSYPADFTLAVQAGANYTFTGTTITPATDFTGTLNVSVTVNDGTDDSAPFVLIVNVTAVNDVPVITAQSGPLSTPEETDIVLALADLVVTDPDNSYPADFTLAVQAGANYTFAGTTVTPNTDFTGTLNVSVTVNDGTDDSAPFVLTVNVTAVNDVPVITAQTGPLSTPEETDIVLTLADLVVTDPDNSYPADFTLAVQAGANYTFAGTTVTPNLDFFGTLNVSVTVNDGTDDSAPFVINVDVTNVNDAPVITAQSGPLSTLEETDIVLTLADLVVTDPDNSYPADFTLAVQAGANYTFAGTTVTPNLDFFGTLNVSVTVNDGTDDSAPFVINVDVTNVNDAPVITAQSGPLSTLEETDIVLTLADLVVTDPDDSYPADFTLAVQAGANYTFAGTTVTPDLDFFGTLNVSVTVNDGTDDSAPFVVNVDVTDVNEVPVITAQVGPLSTPEETDIVLTLADLTVTDPDNSYPADFTLSVQAGANYTFAGTTVTPATDFVGTLNVSVVVNDATDDSAPFVINVDVTAVNDTPVITAQAGPLSTPEETDIVLGLADLAVTDPDNSYPADFSLLVRPGANYSVSGNTVTPALDYNGTLSVPVAVDDGTDTSADFLVSITVDPVNDQPSILSHERLVGLQDAVFTIVPAHLAVTDKDDAYPVGFTIDAQPGANYTASGADITPDLGFTGTLNVPVTVTDPSGAPNATSDPFVVAIDIESGLADLWLDLSVNETRPAIGEQITLSVTVTNDGPNVATGVSVTSVVFAGYKYISDDSGGALSGSTWTAGTVTVGESKTLNVVLEIETEGPYVLAAEILTSDQVDPDSIPGNFVAGEDDIDGVETPPPGIPQDEDGDGIRDALELLLGTDMKKEDTDGDWISDYVEYLAGDDPLVASAGTRTVHVDASVDTPGTGDDWDTAYLTLADALLDPRVSTGGSLNQPVYIRIADSAMPTAGPDWALELTGACDHMVFIGSQDRSKKEDSLPLLTDAGEPTTTLDALGAEHVTVDGCENVWLHGLELTGGDRAGEDGGALRAQNGTRLGLREVWARGNTATNGGGLLATGIGTELTVLDSTIADNAATQSGGGVSVDVEAIAQFVDTRIVRNTSTLSGGGIYASGAILETDNTTVADNVTNGDGGGLFVETDPGSGPGSRIEHSVLSQNVALGSGGGIAVGQSGVYVSVFNTLIVANIAARGAAASFDDNSASMSNVTAVDNRTTLMTAGAAIYVQNATPVVTDSVFTRNLDPLLTAGTFEVFSGSVSSAYNLVEEAPIGLGDIDITLPGAAFSSGYYFDQATSPAVDAGSVTSDLVSLDVRFTDDTGTTPDVGTLDCGYHYADAYPPGNADYIEATPQPGDAKDEVTLSVASGTDVNQLVVVRVDFDNDPFPAGHRIVATIEDPVIATLHTPIGLDPLNDGESVLLIDLGGGDYGFYVDGETLGETDMRLHVDGVLLGHKVKIKYVDSP